MLWDPPEPRRPTFPEENLTTRDPAPRQPGLLCHESHSAMRQKGTFTTGEGVVSVAWMHGMKTTACLSYLDK